MGDEWVKYELLYIVQLSEWIYELDIGIRQAHRALSPGTRPDPVVYINCSIYIVIISPKINKESDVLVVMAGL